MNFITLKVILFIRADEEKVCLSTCLKSFNIIFSALFNPGITTLPGRLISLSVSLTNCASDISVGFFSFKMKTDGVGLSVAGCCAKDGVTIIAILKNKSLEMTKLLGIMLIFTSDKYFLIYYQERLDFNNLISSFLHMAFSLFWVISILTYPLP